MNYPTTHKPHRTSSKGECCTESSCESGLRNNYFDGKRLTTDSFRVEQKYMQSRRHLLNRAIHGWGVVYGYELGASDNKQEGGQLNVGPGLALDACGRELVETGTTIQFNDVSLFDKEGKRAKLDEVLKSLGIASDFSWDDPPQAVIDALDKWCWELSVHYAERDRTHLKIEDHCCCERDEWDHLCETVYYSIRPKECDKCCEPFPCELKCACGTGPCCEEKPPKKDQQQGNNPYAQLGNPQPTTVDPHPRGGCQCLCKHLTNLDIGGECDALCEIEQPCGNVRVDLSNGVPLACVKLATDKCGLIFGEIFDACGPRRLVKRNDLLFDLIRGCDLTRIEDIGWPHHRQDISFDEFANLFLPATDVVGDPVKTKFWVKFSRPVRKKTVRRDCFVVTVVASEPDDVWLLTLRIPIVHVEFRQADSDPELIDQATIFVDGPWYWDTVKGGGSIFQNKWTRVELEVRGDFIFDCNGQTVDGNTYGNGRSPVPSGNGTPGGTFLSTFRVGPAPEPVRPPSYDNEDRI